MNSTNDCDTHFPMNQFNESTMNKVEVCTSVANNNMPSQTKSSTLVLKFSHSGNPCTATVSSDDNTINSPLDIYKQFGKRFFQCKPLLFLFFFQFFKNLFKLFGKKIIYFHSRQYRNVTTNNYVCTA